MDAYDLAQVHARDEEIPARGVVGNAFRKETFLLELEGGLDATHWCEIRGKTFFQRRELGCIPHWRKIRLLADIEMQAHVRKLPQGRESALLITTVRTSDRHQVDALRTARPQRKESFEIGLHGLVLPGLVRRIDLRRQRADLVRGRSWHRQQNGTQHQGGARAETTH